MKLKKMFSSLMSSLMSLVICVTMLCSGISTNAGIVSSEKKTTNSGYDYPIKVGTDEWKKFETHVDMLNACQIPQDVLQNMSTDELIETVLNYPLLVDIYAYDSTQKGFKSVSSMFNGLSNLLQKKDVGTKLLSKYKKMDVPASLDNKLSYVEILLAQDEIINTMSSLESKELEKEVEKKYLKKKGYSNIYGNLTDTYYRGYEEHSCH